MISENKCIILYPRVYNRRGDETLHSVEGLSHEGHLVNIKLRIQGEVRHTDALPSISRFAKTDIRESKVSCLASEDNGPANPAGILIFTECEIDPNNRKSVDSYISRWAHILRNGHAIAGDHTDADLPFIGVGRLSIDKKTRDIREAQESIAALIAEKPKDWEAAVQRNQSVIDDYRSYDYSVYGYLTDQEQRFTNEEHQGMLSFMDAQMATRESGHEAGFMVRVQTRDGQLVSEIHRELFPVYIKRFKRYQDADEMIRYFKNVNPDLEGLGSYTIRIMPMVRYAGRKIFKDSIRNADDFRRLEQTFYIEDSPVAFPMAVKIDRLDNKQHLVNKIHLTGPSVGSPALLGFDEAQITQSKVMPSICDPLDKVVIHAGISEFARPGMASWYEADPLMLSEHEMSFDSGHGEGLLEEAESTNLVEEISTKASKQTPTPTSLRSDFGFTESVHKASLEQSEPGSDQITHAIESTSLSAAVTSDESIDNHNGALSEPGEEIFSVDDDFDLFEGEDSDIDINPEEEEDELVLFGHERESIISQSFEVDPLIQAMMSKRSEQIETPDLSQIIEPSSVDRLNDEHDPSVGIKGQEDDEHVDPLDQRDIQDDEADDETAGWMDNDDLEMELLQAVDAYADETESDLGIVKPGINAQERVLEDAIEADMVSPLTTVTPQAPTKPKRGKGALADFIKKKGLI